MTTVHFQDRKFKCPVCRRIAMFKDARVWKVTRPDRQIRVSYNYPNPNEEDITIECLHSMDDPLQQYMMSEIDG